MTFRAIFYDRHGKPAQHPRIVSAADDEHLPDRFLTVPGGLVYDHDGTDPKGQHVYRERVTR